MTVGVGDAYVEDVVRLTIFGASGQTGRRPVEQALDAGHTVTAVVRDPTRLPIHHQRLQVVVADVLDPAAIQPAVAGADAVLSPWGPPPTQPVIDHVGRHARISRADLAAAILASLQDPDTVKATIAIGY
jgi:NAD(P)-dependent dehydrogenase (short-subunit alcohol dehydrogenase family)